MKSVMNHSFSNVPSINIPRSKFDRSHGHKTTFQAGQLIPVFLDTAYPGDTFSLTMEAFARMSTPLKPVMDNLHFESFFFSVPYRLVWTHWKNFHGEQVNPDDSTDYLIPQLSPPAGGWTQGSIADYFGLPVGVDGISHSALYHRAYVTIWNAWFRDENLQDSLGVPVNDGPDDPATITKMPIGRNKRHDYFTSCLPWPQKGPAVDIPIGGEVPVQGKVVVEGLGLDQKAPGTGPYNVYETAGGGVTTQFPYGRIADPAIIGSKLWVEQTSTGVPSIYGNADHTGSTALVDLSAGTQITINALRESVQIQKLYEKDARGGSRYIEMILSHFGVQSPDARLQRPEYLGGGHNYINISPVAQTSSTDVTSPQGNLSAIGTLSASGHGFTKSFDEHCIVMGMICVRADLTYQTGINRMFSYETRFDFYYPSLAHLGEQEVLNKEIYAQGTADDDLVFGYQERWAEMRYKPSLITGKFRSVDPTSLDIWHLSQDFAALPTLSETFIAESVPMARILAVPDEPHFLLDTYFDYKCVRPMPTYSVPGQMDRF